jgi:hypothetical protein
MILDKSKPYTTSVFQHGTFDSMRQTYGTDLNFSSKPKYTVDDPHYGPFRIGNLPKKGYNKTIGENFQYIEDPAVDTVCYRRELRDPIWKGTTNSTSLAHKPMSVTYKNTGGVLNY